MGPKVPITVPWRRTLTLQWYPVQIPWKWTSIIQVRCLTVSSRRLRTVSTESTSNRSSHSNLLCTINTMRRTSRCQLNRRTVPGINPHQILHKTLAVLNPRRDTDAESLRDTDLAGPLVLVLAFGGFLLLSGKVHFGCIYGIAVLGCLAIFVLVNLMADSGASVAVGVTVSVLGYCLLPMVVLAGISILVSLQDVLGMALTTLAVFWCALSASKLFVTALDMRYQQPL